MSSRLGPGPPRHVGRVEGGQPVSPPAPLGVWTRRHVQETSALATPTSDLAVKQPGQGTLPSSGLAAECLAGMEALLGRSSGRGPSCPARPAPACAIAVSEPGGAPPPSSWRPPPTCSETPCQVTPATLPYPRSLPACPLTGPVSVTWPPRAEWKPEAFLEGGPRVPPDPRPSGRPFSPRWSAVLPCSQESQAWRRVT